jgi:hypothetical protein
MALLCVIWKIVWAEIVQGERDNDSSQSAQEGNGLVDIHQKNTFCQFQLEQDRIGDMV